MSENLKNTIAQLSADFAESLLNAVRSSPIEEIIETNGSSNGKANGKSNGHAKPAKSAKEGGRLPRRSDEDIQKMVKTIVSTLKKAGAEGMRAEVLREKLGVDKKELPKPIQAAIDAKLIKKTGEKRATTYIAK